MNENSTPPSTPAARRPWLRRGIIAFLVVANVAVFGALATLLVAANEVAAEIGTLDAEGLPLTEVPSRPGQPRTFLLVGSDSRESVPEEDLGRFGRFGGQRADVIMLLQVLPDEDRLQLLSIPRDLKVTVDGREMKINATFAGGAGSIARAVTETTGVPINHYMQVDFAGFAGIVDAIGGIEMTFPNPVRDRKSKLDLPAGSHVLDGEQAIALARSRFFEENVEGRWRYVEASDLGRTGRQRDLLMAILTQVDRPSSIGGFTNLVDALGQFVLADDGFDAGEIIELAWEMRDLDAGDVDSMTLPVRITEEGGVSYVVPVEPEATRVLEAFRTETAFTAAAVSPVIEVQNGNGRVGAASAIAAALAEAGYEVAGATNAGRSDYGVTQVLARPTSLSAAEAVRDALGFGDVVSGSLPAGIDVLVIVGLDAPAP